MLKPQFLLTKKIPVYIERRGQGSWQYGEWVEGEAFTIVREVNIQPLKPHEIVQMPEADRTKDWYKVYCAEDLRTTQEGVGGWDADEFVWQGYNYKIMKVSNWAMGTLDHFRAYAARTPVTPN